VDDEASVFERVSLEGFQSGLSWITVLRKRDAFRRAFHGFDPQRVAHMGREDVARLLKDAGIIRNRAKIEATIGNAKAIVALQKEGAGLSQVIWSYAVEQSEARTSLDEVPPFSDDARSLSKELKKRGFRFVGPTTAYAAMQALGVVNDHLDRCHVRSAVEAARADFLRARRGAVKR
jgi:DNA-3-methyladenine glycosylase I